MLNVLSGKLNTIEGIHKIRSGYRRKWVLILIGK